MINKLEDLCNNPKTNMYKDVHVKKKRILKKKQAKW